MSEEEVMAETSVPGKRPQFVKGVRVRMPEDYAFHTWGKDFSEYNKEFRLRTDAVWEKYMLKDWFRLSNRGFFFNPKDNRYLFTEPEDVYTMTYEPWAVEDHEVFDWPDYTNTGMTSEFQVGVGAKSYVENTFNTFYSMPDYYMLCAMRFQKWYRCDMIYYEDRTVDYDRHPDKGLRNLKQEDFYPCFKEWYESTYACADNILKFLIELAYAKRAANFFIEDTSSVEIRSMPTVFDSPSAPERVTYTY